MWLSAMKQKLKQKWPAIAVALLILLLLVGLDQWTKWAVMKSIPYGETLVVVPGFFELTYLHNTGAAFSMMNGMNVWFFVVLTLTVCAMLVYYFFKNDDSKIDFALALILAGAIGNLIDRIAFGYVRDFFQFYIFGSPFAVFNVADVCITLGMILLVFEIIYKDFRASRTRKKE